MPLNSTRGAGSAKGFGFTSGGVVIDFDYLVVAGGGGGVQFGGGGAGGYRTSFPGGTKISLKKGTYPIVVGGGGPSVNPSVSPSGPSAATKGQDSSFSTITSTGGGGGGGGYSDLPPGSLGGTGGSGGGGGHQSGPFPATGGAAGNTPPFSPPQGNRGGTSEPYPGFGGSGGGGAGAAGTNGLGPGNPGFGPGGPGGIGSPNVIYDSPTVGTPGPAPGRYFAGGGGGAAWAGSAGTGGSGGGGAGGTQPSASQAPGTVNTGGGGGGSSNPGTSGTGGSGIVIVRAPSTASFTVSPGTNSVQTAPNGDKIGVFTVSGNLVI